MYEFKDQLGAADVEALDKLYKAATGISVYQHPLWPDNLQVNQRMQYMLQKENDDILLSAKITESHLTKAPFVKYAHVRGGLLFKNASLIFPAVKELLNRYRQLCFARLTVELFCNSQDAELVERCLLKERIDYQHDYNSGVRATLMLSLNDSIEQIHGRFANVLKRNIVTAEKKGAKIKDVTSAEEFEKFIQVYHKMEQSRGVKLGNADYLRGLFNFIKVTGLGHFLACYDKTDVLIGGVLLFKEGRQIEYIVGASDPEYKSIPQSHLALYEGIKLAQSEGIEFFDFGGYGFDAKEGDQIYNINQFKMNFCDNIYFYPKNIVFITNKVNYLIGEAFLKGKRVLG